MNWLRRYIIESINELDYEELDRIGVDHFDMETRNKLPFQNLFNEKQTRVLIPFVPSTAKFYTKALNKAGYDEIDWESGMVSKTIETQRGPKKQQARMGKALGKELETAKKKFEKLKPDNFNQIFDVYKQSFDNPLETIYSSAKITQRHNESYNIRLNGQYLLSGDFIEALGNYISAKDLVDGYNQMGAGYSILITRHPIDVLRMSDFDNIQSCHSKGGQYYDCAVQEAQNGGAIAYLVKNEDIKNLDLNQSDIFKDEARDIDGITPISRIRLRNFAAKDGSFELAVPEDRVYGTDIDGFAKNLKNWAYNNQIEQFRDEEGNINYPSIEDMVLRGGSYQDTAAGILLQNLFGDESGYSSFERIDKENDNDVSLYDQYQQEADAYFEHYDFNHISVNYEVVDDPEEPYVQWNAQIAFEFPEDLPNEIFHYIQNNKRKTIKQLCIDINENTNITVSEYDFYLNISDWKPSIQFDIQEEEKTGHPDKFNNALEYYQFDVDNRYKDRYVPIFNKWLQSIIETYNKPL